jgi:hypothetical protein
LLNILWIVTGGIWMAALWLLAAINMVLRSPAYRGRGPIGKTIVPIDDLRLVP